MQTKKRWGWDTWALIGAGATLALAIALAAPFYKEVCEPTRIESQYQCSTYQVVPGFLLQVMAFFDRHEGFFVGLFTAALFVATLRLWRSTQTLASGGDETLGHLRDSSERQLRAYLEIQPEFASARVVNGRTHLRFAGEVFNKGQTPAYHLMVGVFIRVIPAPLPDAFPEIEGEISRGVLPPGAHVQLLPEAFVVPAADLNEVKTGTRKRVVYFGFVTYEDAFRKVWRQRFCYSLVWGTADASALITADKWNDEVCIRGQEPYQPE